MVSDDASRFTLSSELLRQVEALGQKQALFPSPAGAIDEIVQQLEDINPISCPLQPNHLSSLLGTWQLIYASRGTSVTRTLASYSTFWEVVKIKQIWQTLVTSGVHRILASNNILLDFSLLGEWQLGANGVWTWGEDQLSAKVSFNSFSLQARELFSLPSWSLPELKIPVWEFFQNEALWTTSYLDQNIRVGRGATGNLFVFRRKWELTK